MTQQPNAPRTTGEQFTADYTPPDWYLQHPSPQASDTAPPPWHFVENPATDVRTDPAAACRMCGALEAAPVKVRAHQGLLVAMRWNTLDGPFCGTCGIACVRQMTTRTLCLGWWSPLSLIFGAPFALLSNLVVYRRLRRLPPAVPAPGRPQAELGQPVLRRPLAYVALIPLLWAVWIITHVLTSGA